VGELLAVLADAALIVGHGVFGYDFLALARYHGLDLASLRGRVVDTLVLATLDDPPMARQNGHDWERAYDLDALCLKRFGVGKSGDIKKIAKRHGGYDAIPLGDPEYRAYLERDVEMTCRLYRSMADAAAAPYAVREMEVARRAALVSLAGFRVDRGVLGARLAQGELRRAAALRTLVGEYGVPATLKTGEDATSPLGTAAGRTAVCRAFHALGVRSWPWRTKGGQPSIGQDAMEGVKAAYPGAEAIAELADLVLEVQGTRVVYQTVQDHLVDDGERGWRVHPAINIRQATGRWSTVRPGLTVLGKREGRVRERAVFIPDDGDLLVSVDLSQVDARAVAALSGDRDYAALFAPGRDLWTELSERTGVSRDVAKVLGHAFNYHAGVTKLVATTGIPEETIRLFVANMRERFPRLVEWQEECVERARAGELLDNGWGRRMCPDPERAWTQAPAMMGQGCARDILMRGLIELPEDVARMVRAVVHDEVVLSVPAGAAEDVARQVKQTLETEFRGVPIAAQASEPAVSWEGCYGKS
jgi:DNA polymerase-1